MGIEVPDYLKQGSNAEQMARAAADTAAMSAASMKIPRVSLRGREFRFIENGEEVKKVRDEVNVIIFGVEPEAGRMIKTYYAKGYQPGAKEPPDCSSDDGIAPSPWVNQKQAQTCAQCQWNVFGSAKSPTGKPTKKCRDSKRIWIALAEDPRPLKDRTLFGLNVTVASLQSFADHGRGLQALGMAPAVAVTKLKMLDTEYPQLEFSLGGWVSREDAPIALAMSTDRPWRAMSGAGLALAMSGVGDAGGTVALPGQTAAAQPLPTAPPNTEKKLGDINKDLDAWG
jgi:hypothetical protein